MMTGDVESYAVVDVETASSTKGSICEIGLTIVEAGAITIVRSWRCRPPAQTGGFHWYNTKVHGITAADVAGSPEVGECLREMFALIGDLPVYAHNANFDFGHLHAASTYAGVDLPTLATGCTLTLSRRLLDLVSYRLPFLAAHFGFDATNHHNAGADSVMAAQLVLALTTVSGAVDMAGLCSLAHTRPGQFGPDGSNGMVIRRRGTSTRFDIPDTNIEADPNHPLYGEWVSFTGGLTAFTREPVCALLATLGANPQPKGVNRKTTMLVIGDGFTGNSLEDFTTTKAKRALELRDKGQNIEVFCEDDFLRLLDVDTATL
ncbi:exonuclease domain-containing protein [Rhodococcus sp. T7]|uniref:exonuclease domain-containing protein n=1 Tax=Rhodococcus sp. T7 TaxID=627444 RepID=UPI00135C26D4|nr:exonuclease domain-containing protein [Rhodococcus sp. T7]KAF0957667.1 DNA polymerase III PolC-type [Rhodococcus sp. T7]KAF0963261.1 DNA polymerase III PolC-type [Rhodococcus sp. T7]